MKNLLLLIGLFLTSHFLSNAQTFVEESTKDTITISQVVRTRTVVDTAVTVTRKKYNPPPVVVTPPVTQPETGIPGYTLTFSNSFDSQSDFVSSQLGRGGLTTTKENVYAGTGSFRSEVRSGDQPISSGYRSEQQYQLSGANPTEGIVEYYVKYETIFPSNGHSMQWHPNNSSGSARLALWHESGKWTVVWNPEQYANTYIKTGVTIQRGKWYRMRIEYKFASNNTGYIRWFVDKDLIASVSGKVTSKAGQYIKIGQNLFSAQNSVIYYDELKVYTKK